LSIVLTRAGVGFGFVVLRIGADVGTAVDVRAIGGDRSISLTAGAVDDHGNVLAIVGAIQDGSVRRGIPIAIARRSARTSGSPLPS
jgi:hypothetical protein